MKPKKPASAKEKASPTKVASEVKASPKRTPAKKKAPVKRQGASKKEAPSKKKVAPKKTASARSSSEKQRVAPKKAGSAEKASRELKAGATEMGVAAVRTSPRNEPGANAVRPDPLVAPPEPFWRRVTNNWPYLIGLLMLVAAIAVFASLAFGGDEQPADQPQRGTFDPVVESIDNVVDVTSRCSRAGFAAELTSVVDEPVVVRASVRFEAPTGEVMHRVDANRIEVGPLESTSVTLPYDPANVDDSLRGFTPDCMATFVRLVE